MMTQKKMIRYDLLLVVSTMIFVFGSIYIHKQYFSRSGLTATVQDIALTHCDVLYTEYALFVEAVESDPDCVIAGKWEAAKSEWLDLDQNDRDTLSTAFDTDGSLVIYDEQVQDRIQEWRVMITVHTDDDAEAQELTKDSLEYIKNRFGDAITDIRFLFPETKLTYDYIIEYKTKIWTDIAAFARHLDQNKKYEDTSGKKLVLVNPNVILWHNPTDELDSNYFGTQSFDDTPWDQRYLSFIGHDEAMSCLPEWRPVKIAVVDNGFDLKHPDLSDMIRKWYDEADKDTDAHIPKIEKARNHGTKEAWIIWATHNDFGIKGVMPNAELIVVKSTKDTANGRDITNGIEAIAKAHDMWAEVINLSRWWYGKVPMLERITKKIAGKWGILVAAAGNYNKKEPFFPAAYDRVIAVSAIDQQSNKASFSNYGPWVDIAAPGVDMLTTDLDNTYAKYNGTSEASPVVAGTIALALSHGLGVDDVMDNVIQLENPDLGKWKVDLWFLCESVQEHQTSDSKDTPTAQTVSDTWGFWNINKKFVPIIWRLLLVSWLLFGIWDIYLSPRPKNSHT